MSTHPNYEWLRRRRTLWGEIKAAIWITWMNWVWLPVIDFTRRLIWYCEDRMREMLRWSRGR